MYRFLKGRGGKKKEAPERKGYDVLSRQRAIQWFQKRLFARLSNQKGTFKHQNGTLVCFGSQEEI